MNSSRSTLLLRSLVVCAIAQLLGSMGIAYAQSESGTSSAQTRGPYQYGAGPIVPATTLTPATPQVKSPTVEGFIQRWIVLEPLPSSGLSQSAVQAAVKKDYFSDQMTILPHDGDKVSFAGSELSWHAQDTKNYNFNLFHFARALGKPTTDVLFWAVTVVNAPEDMTNVRLAIGSNAASVWWLNGEEVVGIYGDRQTVIDDGVSRRLTLKKGPNVLRAAIVNGGGATDFCARFLDANNKPLTKITISLPRK